MNTNVASNRHAKRRWAVAIFLVLAGGVGGSLWWYAHPPLPPEVSLDGLDPAVAAAIVEARAEVAANPRSGADWGQLGRTLLANEVFRDVSLTCFEHASRLEPDNPRWPYFRGGLLLSSGKLAEALLPLQRALELDLKSSPSHSVIRLLLAETLVALERPAEALAHYQEVLRIEPDNPRAHFGLGLLATAQEEWSVGRKHFELCLGAPQARQKAAVRLATICERLGDAKNAAHYAHLAARLPKDLDWTDLLVLEHADLVKRRRDRYRTAEQLEAEGRLAQAARVIAELLRDEPDDASSHLMMGRLLAQMGQFPRAEDHLNRALQLTPDKIQVRYLLSLTLFRHGEALWLAPDADRRHAVSLFEQAAATSRQVLERRPDFGFAHMSLGLALKYLDRKAEALAAFQRAVLCNPEYADNHLHLGIALADEGRLVEARPYLQQALLLAAPNDPRPKEALQKLGTKGK